MTEPEQTQKARALIVDDDAFLVGLYEKQGETAALEIKTATGGQQALDVIEKGFVPDIVALDMSMAGMSGVDVIKALRERNLAPNAKIIILSNTAEDELVAEAKGLGVEHFIVKASLLPSEVMEQLAKIAGGRT